MYDNDLSKALSESYLQISISNLIDNDVRHAYIITVLAIYIKIWKLEPQQMCYHLNYCYLIALQLHSSATYVKITVVTKSKGKLFACVKP
jgi:hypothetical protein